MYWIDCIFLLYTATLTTKNSHIPDEERKLSWLLYRWSCWNFKRMWWWWYAFMCMFFISYRYYTGCPRRNGQNFGRVFLMLKYTDITQNAYIQSWTVTEIMAIEKCGLLGGPRSVRRPWRHIRHCACPATRHRNAVTLANALQHGSSDVTR